jgi:hypothetical protein
VLIGDGHGGFPRTYQRPGGSGIDAIAIADLDGDGHLDLATSGLDGAGVWLGVGDGTFGQRRVIAENLGTAGATVGDFNGDGAPDLAFALTEEGEQEFITWLIAFMNWSGNPAPPCIVPYRLEARLPAVMRRITRAGCSVGTVTWRHSRKIPAGQLITHRPRSSTVLASGAPVDLVVSQGRPRP